MMPNTKIYAGIYLVVSVQQHVGDGKWIKIWGSGGFWTVFIRDSLNNILTPICENDLLESVELRPSTHPYAAALGIAQLYQYCVLEDAGELWL